MFLLIGEVLSNLITRATEIGLIKGIEFQFHQEHITHFQYADDTILFIDNSEHSIRGFKKILQLFQVIT